MGKISSVPGYESTFDDLNDFHFLEFYFLSNDKSSREVIQNTDKL